MTWKSPGVHCAIAADWLMEKWKISSCQGLGSGREGWICGIWGWGGASSKGSYSIEHHRGECNNKLVKACRTATENWRLEIASVEECETLGLILVWQKTVLVKYVYDPCTQKVKAGGWGVQGYLLLQSKSESILGYIGLHFRRKGGRQGGKEAGREGIVLSLRG